MKLCSLCLLCLAAVAPAEDPEPVAMIRFGNQDQLGGTLESLTRDQVIWNSPMQTKPAAFRLDEVLDLTLPAETPMLKATHEATLTLARGDSVRGQLAAVTDQFVELDTWFAGRMEFPRAMVREVRISDRPPLVFRGPSSLEGWTQSADPPSWKFQSASLRAGGPGSIGRNVELPEEFRLTFDASWNHNFNMSVIFFSDDVSVERPDHGYELTFTKRSVRLQRCGEHTPVGNPASATELQDSEKARIEIRASEKTKTICFFVNDRIVEVWSDPQLKRGNLGRGIQFVTQDNEPIRISGIEVSAWDGIVDETPPKQAGNRFRDLEVFGGAHQDAAAEEEPDKSDEGRMMFRNGDSIAGEVASISNGMITVKTSFNEVKFPLVRLRNIMLKPVELEEPRRMAGDVRGWFMDGSSLVFRLDQVKGSKISGFSQNFGTAEFDLKAFNRLEFNIYNSKFDGIRDAEE